ncbi:DUF5641 domain-containing protein [Caerostris extrusa]|uniref:DUF5641 domain-containing protein n=1 Tax=Caerostris extrusa TaxID=172846 RepID=A0AAV4WXT4_CAEEX|nr:DUF5641 domain-containing protein [Caerostris extrusa]
MEVGGKKNDPHCQTTFMKSFRSCFCILRGMITLLCECESIVNGRPLTYIYNNPNELSAIKPSDFIQDIKGNEIMELDVVDAKHLRKRISLSAKTTLSTISEGIFIRTYSE